MSTKIEEIKVDYTKPQLYKNRHEEYYVFSTGAVDNDGFKGVVIHSETPEMKVGDIRLWAKSAFVSCSRSITFNYESL